MGSSCCHTESPCGSVEERSVLLKDDTKATVSTGNPIVVGTCGPQPDDELRITLDESDIATKVKAEAVQAKKCLEVGQPNNTQENGPLKELYIRTAAPSPRKGSDLKENSTRAQDEDMMDSLKDSEDSGLIGLLQCTLNSPQKDQDTDDLPEANTAPEDVNSASAQDEPPDTNPQSAEVACLENHTGIEVAMDCSISTPQYNDEEAGSKIVSGETEVLGQFCEKNEGLSLPSTELTTAACQLLSISVVSEEMESLSCAVTEDFDNGSSSVCKESGCEIRTSHDICESSYGSDPTEFDHSGEEQGATHYIGEPATTVSEDASERPMPDQDAKPNPSCVTTVSEEVTSLENTDNEIVDEIMLKGQDKDEKEKDAMKEEVWRTPTRDRSPPGKDAESQEVSGKEEQLVEKLSTGVAADEIAASEKEVFAEDGPGNSEEDLYRGAEELSAGQPPKFLKLEDRCSLAPAMDILSYSEREWKGNTAKSALIRKGYKEMSQRFCSVRRVRGDNYCALRATLFQVLSHSPRLPSWLQEEDFTMLPKQLEAQEGLISPWLFPGECLQRDGTGDATLQLQGYMEQLWTKWQAAVDCSSATERQQLCEQVFQGGEEEFGLMEALKLLMLSRAVELHASMQAGGDVPLFCWLLFARDSSDCPRSFLSNHLSHVGLSAGLEQVEMFLLGYALQCTIQVYRLYKADTEEFVTYYPDDHKDDWPSVCLVTEDDRHYNVPIVEAAEHKELDLS